MIEGGYCLRTFVSDTRDEVTWFITDWAAKKSIVEFTQLHIIYIIGRFYSV